MLLQKRPDYLPIPRGKCSDPAGWQPVPLSARAPGRGVAVQEGGLFHAAMRENIDYLLRSFSVDHMTVSIKVCRSR